MWFRSNTPDDGPAPQQPKRIRTTRKDIPARSQAREDRRRQRVEVNRDGRKG